MVLIYSGEIFGNYKYSQVCLGLYPFQGASYLQRPNGRFDEIQI